MYISVALSGKPRAESHHAGKRPLVPKTGVCESPGLRTPGWASITKGGDRNRNVIENDRNRSIDATGSVQHRFRALRVEAASKRRGRAASRSNRSSRDLPCSKCPMEVQSCQGLKPFFQIEPSKTDRRPRPGLEGPRPTLRPLSLRRLSLPRSADSESPGIFPTDMRIPGDIPCARLGLEGLGHLGLQLVRRHVLHRFLSEFQQ